MLFIYIKTVRASAECEICRFSSNGVIVKIFLHDLDLLFEGKRIKKFISVSKTVRARSRNVCVFCRF